ncbi:MAG: ammonium transporter [Pseudomonadota bacterium]|nr:MAG: ammonium transporter [Pseudomonadota bacterium]
MRRLYFLLPNIETTRTVVDELLLARIEERHIHAIAKEGTPMGDLPEATLAQKSDVVPALERGIAVGGATGVLAGLVAVTFPPAGIALGGGALLAIALAGSGFGAIMSTMIGVSVPNSRLKQFEDAVNKGEVLMLVDVPKARVDEIEKMVKQHHPDADIEGTEPTIPAFP